MPFDILDGGAFMFGGGHVGPAYLGDPKGLSTLKHHEARGHVFLGVLGAIPKLGLPR